MICVQLNVLLFGFSCSLINFFLNSSSVVLCDSGLSLLHFILISHSWSGSALCWFSMTASLNAETVTYGGCLQSSKRWQMALLRLRIYIWILLFFNIAIGLLYSHYVGCALGENTLIHFNHLLLYLIQFELDKLQMGLHLLFNCVSLSIKRTSL